MLPLPNLDEKTYAQLFEECKNKIPTLTSEWTDFNMHDPGITMLQLFAWLFEMQHYYANFIGDNHIYKYLELLGYTPERERASTGVVTISGVDNPLTLPVGFKLLAGETVFETEESVRLRDNEIVEIRRDSDFVDITELALSLDGGYENIFTNKPKSHFYIGFRKDIGLKDAFQLYFKIYEGKYSRNPFYKNKLNLSKLKWEVYTSDGWQNIPPIKDETMGFLKDGFITFYKKIKMAPLKFGQNKEAYYYLKCTLLENQYDVRPKIDFIGINEVKVSQKDTKAVNVYIDGTGESSYTIPHYLGTIGEVVVVLKNEKEEWEVCAHTDYTLSQEERFLIKLCFREDHKPHKGVQNIRIICYEKDFYSRRKQNLGEFKGYINQKFKIGEADTYYNLINLDVMVQREDKTYYTTYKPIKNMGKANGDNRVFVVDYEDNIVFGDKTHGALPEEKNAKLILTAFATTKGSKGNVKAGKINKVIDLKSGLKVMNEMDTIGGRDRETKEEAIRHFRRNFKEGGRLLTIEDYEKLVKQTPGLLIHKVCAISENTLKERDKRNNNIYIIVKPYGEEERPVLPKAYKRAIEAQLEPYRLLTTQIKVESPLYLAIDLSGRIYKNAGFEEKVIAEQIYEYVKRSVDSLGESRSFGEPIILGNLFGKIDSLEGVSYIDELVLTPIGRGGRCSLNGDIMINPNVLTYLRNYSIELR